MCSAARHMWTEWVSPEMIDSRIWPRTAAIAERLLVAARVTDVDDMYRRLTTSACSSKSWATHEMTSHAAQADGESKTSSRLRPSCSVLEPVKDTTGPGDPTTMLSPLTGLVDAARADSEGPEFAAMVDGLLKDAPRFQSRTRNAFSDTLYRWRDIRPGSI